MDSYSGSCPPKKVRLPTSAVKRSQLAYCKLLKRVDPRSHSPFEWKGRIFRSGSSILESDLWPDGTFPRKPLIVEFAGAENPARGWNRHNSDNSVILWRYERPEGKDGEFVEVGRVVAPGAMWPLLMEPLVRDAMAQEMGFPKLDLDVVRSRIARVLSAELDLVEKADRGRILTLVHDELAARIADWSDNSNPFADLVRPGTVPRVV